MTMSMREIAREAEHLHRIIDETQLDDAMMSDEDRAAMAAMVEDFRDAAEAKVDAYVSLIDDAKDRAAVHAAEAKALAERAAERRERAESAEREAEKWSRLLMYAMRALKADALAGEKHRVKIVNAGGKQGVMLRDGVEWSQVPAAWRTVKYDANKDTLREALERGDPEALAVACLVPRQQRLNIK